MDGLTEEEAAIVAVLRDEPGEGQRRARVRL